MRERGRRAHAQEGAGEQRSDSGRLQRQRDRELRPEKRQQGGGDPGATEVRMVTDIIVIITFIFLTSARSREEGRGEARGEQQEGSGKREEIRNRWLQVQEGVIHQV